MQCSCCRRGVGCRCSQPLPHLKTPCGQGDPDRLLQVTTAGEEALCLRLSGGGALQVVLQQVLHLHRDMSAMVTANFTDEEG